MDERICKKLYNEMALLEKEIEYLKYLHDSYSSRLFLLQWELFILGSFDKDIMKYYRKEIIHTKAQLLKIDAALAEKRRRLEIVNEAYNICMKELLRCDNCNKTSNNIRICQGCGKHYCFDCFDPDLEEWELKEKEKKNLK